MIGMEETLLQNSFPGFTFHTICVYGLITFTHIGCCINMSTLRATITREGPFLWSSTPCPYKPLTQKICLWGCDKVSLRPACTARTLAIIVHTYQKYQSECTFQAANSKDTDQAAHPRSLICVFTDRIWRYQFFSNTEELKCYKSIKSVYS